MANTTTISNSTVNQNNFAPTGQVNIVSGLGNPFPMACVANQQINVGDAIIQNNDATAGFVGLPVACVSGNNFTSSVNNQGANNLAIQSLQKAVASNFAGFSVSYRSAKNTSYGKNSDRIGVATGRVKLAVDTNANNGVYNSTGATPIGTAWGVSVACINPGANNANASVNPGLYVAAGNVTGPSPGNGANYAIGRQAEPKAAGDAYVWVDLVSTLIMGGVQEPATT